MPCSQIAQAWVQHALIEVNVVVNARRYNQCTHTSKTVLQIEDRGSVVARDLREIKKIKVSVLLLGLCIYNGLALLFRRIAGSNGKVFCKVSFLHSASFVFCSNMCFQSHEMFSEYQEVEGGESPGPMEVHRLVLFLRSYKWIILLLITIISCLIDSAFDCCCRWRCHCSSLWYD